MTGTSSARPADLQAYPGALEPMDEALDRLANDLDEGLEAFKAGAGEFAPGFAATGPGTWVRELAAESRHLGAWVLSVGNAFEEAGSTGIVEMDDSELSKLVGEPSILAATAAQEGQDAAADLKELLEANGIDPQSFDPDDLLQLDPRDPEYLELYELLEEIGGQMWSEHFAVGFYDQMNTDGIRALLGVIEMFAAHQQSTPWFENPDTRQMEPAEPPDLGSIQENLLDPFVHGFAVASGSVDLEEERRGLLDIGDDPNSDDHWKQHQLALLLSDEGHHYDPTFLAEAADHILFSNTGANWPQLGHPDHQNAYSGGYRYAPLAIGPELWDDPALAFNELIAMRALAGNEDASYEYLQLDGGEDRIGRLETLLRPDVYELIQGPVQSQNSLAGSGSPLTYDDAEELAALMQQYGADAIDGATVDAVRNDPSRYSTALDTYADIVRVVGEGDIPDVTKRVVANSFALYVDDIGELALEQVESGLTEEEAGRRDFNRPDLVDFFQELGYDEEAAAQLGESMSVYAAQSSVPLLEGQPDTGDMQNAFREVALVLGAIEDGFTATGDDLADAHAGFVKGLQTGGAVLRVVGVAAIPATGGTSLLLTGASTLAAPILDAGIEAAAGDPDSPPLTGGQIETALTEELRRDLAILLAERDGRPTPQPGEYAESLSELFEHGDPVEYLDDKASDEANDYDEDDHWGARPR